MPVCAGGTERAAEGDENVFDGRTLIPALSSVTKQAIKLTKPELRCTVIFMSDQISSTAPPLADKSGTSS